MRFLIARLEDWRDDSAASRIFFFRYPTFDAAITEACAMIERGEEPALALVERIGNQFMERAVVTPRGTHAA